MSRPAQASQPTRAECLKAVATASALLAVWQLSVPDDDEIDGNVLSDLQVAARGVDELVTPAVRRIQDLDMTNPAATGDPIRLLVAGGLASMLERALWRTCSGDEARPRADDLRATAGFIGAELRQFAATAEAKGGAA